MHHCEQAQFVLGVPSAGIFVGACSQVSDLPYPEACHRQQQKCTFPDVFRITLKLQAVQNLINLFLATLASKLLRRHALRLGVFDQLAKVESGDWFEYLLKCSQFSFAWHDQI
jgi:hypothetical protein